MIVVRINGKVVQTSNESWSSVDPGGFEACTFSVTNTEPYPDPGSDIKIYDNLALCWEGRVEEPGDDYSTHAALGVVSGVGYGARLRDDTYNMVYIGRDLDGWTGMAITREAAWGANYDPKNAPEVISDPTTGAPGLKMQVGGPIGGSSGGVCEAFYDSGVGNTIKQIQLQSTVMTISASATYATLSYVSDDAVTSGITTLMTDQDGNSIAFRRDISATARRYALIQFVYNAASAVTTELSRTFQYVAVIGDHGVTLQQNGAGLDGFYPSDIANHVRQQASNIDAGNIEQANSYTAIHVAYKERVPYEQIISDMANLMGWHWGVWEPSAITGVNPRLDFCSRPTTPTASVKRKDCAQISLSKSLSRMYNRARVTYTDPFGSQSVVTVEIAHPDLKGITRTIDLDIGVGNSTAATTYGTQILTLSQTDSRAQGSLTLPPTVMTGNRPRPSHLLRAGLDRLKVDGLPIVNITSSVNSNSFRVKRVASEVVGDGVKTTVEVDNGADLIEVLQARLGQAQYGPTRLNNTGINLN